MLPPESAMVRGAVVVTVPPLQLPNVPLATVSPTGSVSVNATPVSAAVLAAGLVTVNVSDAVAFSAMLLALKALLSVGGANTLTVAVLLVVPVPPSVEVMAPVVLLASPAAVPLTSTLNVHDAFWLTVPPERLMEPEPAAAVTVPPQLLLTLGVLATTRVPVVEGSVSLKPTPVSVVERLGLLMVKVSVAVPFKGIVAALKALLIVGEAAAVTVSRDTVVATWPSGLVMVTSLKPAGAPTVLRLK